MSYVAGIARRVHPFRIPMLVVAFSALLALLFTIATRPSDETAPRAAGEAKVQLVKDEHALVADLIRGIREKDEAERLAAAQDRADMRARTVVDTRQHDAPVRIAQSIKPPLRVALPAVMPPPRPEIDPAPPIRVAASPPPSRPLMARTRAAFATVREVPSWLRAGAENVADWALSASAKAISQLPERRFL